MSSSENTSLSEKTASFYSALDAARDFAALLALTIWGVYVFERIQVGDRSPLNPIKILGVAYLLIYLPGRLANAFRSVAPVLSESLISLLVLVTAPILGWLSGPAMGALFAWPMAAGGFVLAGMSLAGLWRKSSRRNTVMMLCVGTLVSIRMVSCVYGEFFINPIMVEGLLYGEGHTDSMCAMSLVQMAKNYSASSTGLHGTPFLAYHTGAYWFLGYFGNLLNVDMVENFNLFYPVVFVPLFIKSLLSAGAKCAELAGRKLAVGGMYWFAVAAVTLSYLPMYDRQPLLSYEPYSGPAHTLALYLCFDLLVVAMEWWARRDRRSASTAESAVCFVLTAATLAVLSWFKISSGTMFLCLIGVLFFRMKLFRNWRWWIAIGGCAALFVIELPWLMAPNYSSDFENKHQLFAFLRQYVPPTLWLEYYLFRLVPVAVLLALQLHNGAINNLGEAVTALKQGRLIKSELGLIMFVVSQGPNSFMNIGFGAGENFVNASYWFIATMILSEVLDLRPVECLKCCCAGTTWRDASIGNFGAGCAMGGVALVWLFNGAYDCKTILFQHQYSRGIRPAAARSIDNTSFLNPGEDDERIRDERRKLLAGLRNLDHLPLSEKRATALFIPKTNRLYWNMLKNGRRPQAIAFVAPALSGLVSIDGVPEPTSEFKLEAYSFETYKERNITSASRTPAENKVAVLSAAKKFGFAKVLVFDQDAVGKSVQAEWTVE